MPGPTVNTIKRLFAVSGNTCAVPRCREPIIDGGVVVGDMCHIRAANPNGPRYDPAQTEAERHAFENLVLLCKKHHAIVDTDSHQYTVSVLTRMKEEHESKQHVRFAISDSLAMRLALFGAGAGAASMISEVGRTVRDLVKVLSELFPAKSKRGEVSVPELLAHFGPGQVAFYSDYELGNQLGRYFLDLFRKQGWQVVELGPSRPDFITQFNHPTLTILMSHKNQDMAFKAVAAVLDAVLDRAGFRRINEGNWEKTEGRMLVVLGLI
jgi:hypothetical protein